MNEQDLANKVVQRLDHGLVNIKQGTLYQLQSARKVAIDGYREAPQLAFGLGWASNIAFQISHSQYFNSRNLLASGLLVLSLLAVTYWQVVIQANDIADIDVSLLTGDLPINAYLDSDFEAWLKRSSQ
jgi:Protein of unknown function (DUF3619)